MVLAVEAIAVGAPLVADEAGAVVVIVQLLQHAIAVDAEYQLVARADRFQYWSLALIGYEDIRQIASAKAEAGEYAAEVLTAADRVLTNFEFGRAIDLGGRHDFFGARYFLAIEHEYWLVGVAQIQLAIAQATRRLGTSSQRQQTAERERDAEQHKEYSGQ